MSLEYSKMVIEKIKLRNIADLSMDKVHCCYFDEGNLKVRCERRPQNYRTFLGNDFSYRLRLPR